ncbi:MAG TPA: hypothetical protein VNO84_02775 [Burkholderiaceae bacterium]|nr:hypothetical protein [Burkholderiaceae bacterium]
MTTGPTPRRTAVRLEFGFDGDSSFDAPAMRAPRAFAGLQAGAAPASAGRGRKPLIETVEQPLTAAEVLARFRAHRQEWYAEELTPFVEGIERQLAHEAALSERLGGLPATDHPSMWLHGVECATAACLPRKEAEAVQDGQLAPRLKLWQPDVWWMYPIVRRKGHPLNMRLPLADTANDLVSELAERIPDAWRGRRVVVQLEVETRLYWGGCVPSGVRAEGGQAEGTEAETLWQPCSFRGDGIGFSEDLLYLRRGEPHWLIEPHAAQAPLIRRSLRAGVGLLVAVPMVSFELQETRFGWIKRQAMRILRRLGLKKTIADRDPTFAHRLAEDERYWCAALGQPVPQQDELERIQKLGGWLAPASTPATAHRPAAPAGDSHVVLLHGGLTSARSGFEAWLERQAATCLGRPWNGQMPVFNDVPVWRFEHDTFLRVGRNVNQLVDALEQQVIGNQERGTLVLVAHSRGGNVARFALERLRQRWPGWRFFALTAGSPHQGTEVFRSIGRRWGGAALLVGWFREAASDVLGKQQLVDLLILERALAYDIPPGFRDVEPEGVTRMARGQPLPLPEGMWVWGSEWGPVGDRPLEDGLWRRVVEDWAGFEADGDGIVPKVSAMAGCPHAEDASPVFHTGYFEHRPTVAQMRGRIESLLAGH